MRSVGPPAAGRRVARPDVPIHRVGEGQRARRGELRDVGRQVRNGEFLKRARVIDVQRIGLGARHRLPLEGRPTGRRGRAGPDSRASPRAACCGGAGSWRCWCTRHWCRPARTTGRARPGRHGHVGGGGGRDPRPFLAPGGGGLPADAEPIVGRSGRGRVQLKLPVPATCASLAGEARVGAVGAWTTQGDFPRGPRIVMFHVTVARRSWTGLTEQGHVGLEKGTLRIHRRRLDDRTQLAAARVRQVPKSLYWQVVVRETLVTFQPFCSFFPRSRCAGRYSSRSR